MDATSLPSSNNVTVEYTDPSGLFPQVKPFLSEALPLRNLHWKSPSRPLRSIDSLHIDFVPAHSTTDEQRRLSDGSVSQRRHQIPGLRRTPYLKIYLLRCDDNEIYKTTSRRVLREWIKSHGFQSQSSSSGSGGTSSTAAVDNHDAFEWLIIHVIPATGRGSEVEKIATSKWPGRGSTSVLEKIKADFNGTSKSAVDRVVQLRLPKAESEKKKSPELTAQIEDLVSKLKSTVLTSFDVRVSQYEADIREKDSQRNLPGWNFCTFFILKEGLALGFENVGLYEDALIGYDELSAGLDSALRDQLSGAGDQHGGTFLPYSKDIKAKAEEVLANVGKGGEESEGDEDEGEEKTQGQEATTTTTTALDSISLDPSFYPLEAQRKSYRELILANNISVFDFRVYIFSRQLALLLKAAKSVIKAGGVASNKVSGTRNLGQDDLPLLAEICERASEFTTLAARTLHVDLESGLADPKDHEYDEGAKEDVISNMVSSWTFAAALQVLSQTSTNIMEVPAASLRSTKDLVEASIITAFAPETRPGNIPKRSSSLVPSPKLGSGKLGASFPVSAGQMAKARPSLTSLKSDTPTQLAGAVEFASARADLYLLARRVLSSIGQKWAWDKRWNDLSLLLEEVSDGHDSTLANVSLDDDDGNGSKASQGEAEQASGPSPSVSSSGIETPVLITAIQSSEQFHALYEQLTDQMFRHYIASNRVRSAEAAIADIAVRKYRLGDYSSAASYFHQLSTFYGNSGWETLEGAMLELYGQCLKHLDRKDEYVFALVRLLGLHAKITQRSSISYGRASVAQSRSASTTYPRINHYIEDLFETSRSLSRTFTIKIQDFFAIPKVDTGIVHFSDRDGFQVQLSLRFLLGESIPVDSVRIRLASSVEAQGNELWLEKTVGSTVESRTTKTLLDSLTTVQGKYYVEHIELRTGNIIFTQDYGSQEPSHDVFQESSMKDQVDERPFVICYPAAQALDAQVSQSNVIDLGATRAVDVEIKSSWNQINAGAVRLKPGTAGLRLLIADTTVVDGSITIEEVNSGKIEFKSLNRNSSVTLRIPYTMEGSQSTLSISLEIEYETEHGEFSFSNTYSVLATLPVSVNVQDLFEDKQLFSRFTISPGMMIPIRVTRYQMARSQRYEIYPSMQQGDDCDDVFDIFPKQPVSLLYNIKQRADADNKAVVDDEEPSVRSLQLSIEYTCLNEECLSVLERRFTRDIEQTSFVGLKRLLLSHLLGVFRSHWTAHDLERIGLVREIGMFGYEVFHWKTVTSCLSGEMQRRVILWLKEWQAKNHTLPLDEHPSPRPRHIIIPVDIPEIQVVHTVELTLRNSNSNNSNNTPHITGVGEMIQAELTIHHTRRWCPTTPDARESPDSVEFTYEILCNPETWLVGGRRRGNFKCAEGERRTFQIVLLPQRAGHLLLPTVDVKSFSISTESGDDGGGDGGGGSQRQQISSEVDYRNHSEMVLVTPNMSTTMVDLGEFGARQQHHHSHSHSHSQSQHHGHHHSQHGGKESGNVEPDKRVSIATG